ncbi:hypothetical protein ABZT27_34980 [Streptomyces sp. NPDC005389]|uniref:hypothetical protein n=1 Tax=Streptomyces sp. NPDC005389 TaxID=3157040 RepID=UPI0033AFE3BB
MAEVIADLRYGTQGVNCWSAAGFLLGYTPWWGAFPGRTRQDIGSGVGCVRNAFMLEDVEKTVLRAPFTPAPQGLVTGDPSLSPRPPYLVTHRTALTTVERLTRFTAEPRLSRPPAPFAAALRGWPPALGVPPIRHATPLAPAEASPTEISCRRGRWNSTSVLSLPALRTA